jgi:hypothetical protein
LANYDQAVPTLALDYSLMWDLNLGFWTPEVFDARYRSRMVGERQYLAMARAGHFPRMGGELFGSAEFIINCPIVVR